MHKDGDRQRENSYWWKLTSCRIKVSGIEFVSKISWRQGDLTPIHLIDMQAWAPLPTLPSWALVSFGARQMAPESERKTVRNIRNISNQGDYCGLKQNLNTQKVQKNVDFNRTTRMYPGWNLCTLYLPACQVRVTEGDSGYFDCVGEMVVFRTLLVNGN